MFTLYIKDNFAAAHHIEDYHGKCEELHGHNFTVEVLFSGEKLGRGGMLVDFKLLKGLLKNVLEGLDHKYINEIPFFRERASSSEYIAMYIFYELKKLIENLNVALYEVRVWESEKAYAAFRE
ncbi:MAG: 6-carboxytetrahydropterin synthase [Syntrophorhabdaceae bacterium]|nr:6-carboxytetrahydropterin synthase [Syntrophorhabdaceae bacterium]